MTETIGIRELRQNASRYIEIVECGEEIVVTRRGVPVARLVPVEPTDAGDPVETTDEQLQQLLGSASRAPARRASTR